MRRIIAGVVIVIVIVLILIGVSSCSSGANKSALESYTSNVNSLIKQSQNNSTLLFQQLKSGVNSSKIALTGIPRPCRFTRDSNVNPRPYNSSSAGS